MDIRTHIISLTNSYIYDILFIAGFKLAVKKQV